MQRGYLINTGKIGGFGLYLPISICVFALLLMLIPGQAWAGADCIDFEPQAQYHSYNFTIHYDENGVNAPDPSDLGKEVKRSDGLIIGYARAQNGIPDYVEEAAVSLEYAREAYRIAGFRLPQHQVVYIKDDLGAYGIYAPTCGEIFLEPDLAGLTRTATHELFHAVQYEYWSLEDFAAIPGKEQAFYKEATADAAMIQVMRPKPYISLFENPDAQSLFESGTGAAHFWIYYGEQFGFAFPDMDLMPGLVGLADYFEWVAHDDYDLKGALEIQSKAIEGGLEGVLENFLLTNGIHHALDGVDPQEHPTLDGYAYIFGYLRGFYNAVLPVGLDPLDTGEPERDRHIEIAGQIAHRQGADYFEIPMDWFEAGAHITGRFASASHAQGRGKMIVTTLRQGKLYDISMASLGSEGLNLPKDEEARLFIVLSNFSDDPLDYDVVIEDGRRLVDSDADGYSTAAGDCDDAQPQTHPDADEVADGQDNDCDGLVDESLPEPTSSPSPSLPEITTGESGIGDPPDGEETGVPVSPGDGTGISEGTEIDGDGTEIHPTPSEFMPTPSPLDSPTPHPAQTPVAPTPFDGTEADGPISATATPTAMPTDAMSAPSTEVPTASPTASPTDPSTAEPTVEGDPATPSAESTHPMGEPTAPVMPEESNPPENQSPSPGSETAVPTPEPTTAGEEPSPSPEPSPEPSSEFSSSGEGTPPSSGENGTPTPSQAGTDLGEHDASGMGCTALPLKATHHWYYGLLFGVGLLLRRRN